MSHNGNRGHRDSDTARDCETGHQPNSQAQMQLHPVFKEVVLVSLLSFAMDQRKPLSGLFVTRRKKPAVKLLLHSSPRNSSPPALLDWQNDL